MSLFLYRYNISMVYYHKMACIIKSKNLRLKLLLKIL